MYKEKQLQLNAPPKMVHKEKNKEKEMGTMTRKRLTREAKWGFQYFPYHQLWMENELFTGWVGINYLTDGDYYYWEYPKAGKVPVAGKGMCWMTLLPEGQSRSITAKITKEREISTWYVDVIDGVFTDEDGVVGFVDKYLDVLFTTAGDVIVDDRDELDAAYEEGILSEEQYRHALAEGDCIIEELCSDIPATETWCKEVFRRAEEMIAETSSVIFLDIDGVLDVFCSSAELQTLLPGAVGNLANLVNRMMAKVVVVSDWRFGSKQCEGFSERLQKHWEILTETLEKHQIKITDVTDCDGKYPNRTEEIKAYLAEHPEVMRYVILDDCFGDDYSSDPEIKKHLVFVDALRGLQLTDCIKACEVLNSICLERK